MKDHVLGLKDSTRNIYVTDKGDGVELLDYLIENRLYSIFETNGVFLTTTRTSMKETDC